VGRYRISVKIFKQFYIENKTHLFAYLMRMTGDYYLASDILQESFTRLWSRYRAKNWCKALLFKIARNALIDEKRKSKYRQSQELNDTHGARNYGQDFFVRESYREVLKAIQRLEPLEKDILVMKITSNLAYREIAEIVGTSEANIKIKIHRARMKLKSLIKKEG
jgi:RNA polymerase sigma-70 factor, ECF subfamily